MTTSDAQRFTLRSGEDGVLVAEGELDLATVEEMRERLADATITTVDLAGTTFIDSVALSVLIEAHQRRSAAGGLILRAPSAPVRRIVEFTALDDYLVIEPR